MIWGCFTWVIYQGHIWNILSGASLDTQWALTILAIFLPLQIAATLHHYHTSPSTRTAFLFLVMFPAFVSYLLLFAGYRALHNSTTQESIFRRTAQQLLETLHSGDRDQFTGLLHPANAQLLAAESFEQASNELRSVGRPEGIELSPDGIPNKVFCRDVTVAGDYVFIWKSYRVLMGENAPVLHLNVYYVSRDGNQPKVLDYDLSLRE